MKKRFVAIVIFSMVALSLAYQTPNAETLIPVKNETAFESLKGEWHFIRNQKGSPISAPPTFDIIEFLPQKKIRLHSTLDGKDFIGVVEISADTISYTFHPPEIEKPIQHQLKIARSETKGDLTLIFKDRDEERGVVYTRPENLLFSEVAGEWFAETPEGRATMSLRKDGGFSMQNEVSGYYRAFNSYRGKAIMAALRFGEIDTHIVFWLYERNGNKLKLVPLQGPSQGPTVIWSLSK